jgi:Ca2+-transporting ATPase
MGTPEVRAMAFSTLIVANLGLIVVNASWSRNMFATLQSKNGPMLWVIGGASIFLALAVYFPPMGRLFQFGPLGVLPMLGCLVAGVVSVSWFELPKMMMARKGKALLQASVPSVPSV